MYGYTSAVKDAVHRHRAALSQPGPAVRSTVYLAACAINKDMGRGEKFNPAHQRLVKPNQLWRCQFSYGSDSEGAAALSIL